MYPFLIAETNITLNDTTGSLFTLGPTLAITTSLGIVIGTIFSILCIINYVTQPSLRTHNTYIFYFMLIYCLISSFISVPIFLMGYYLNLFQNSISLCQTSTIHYLTINIGMVTSLAYASVERHYLIFRKNGLLTWTRQLFPAICILIYSYIVAILFTLIPTCTYTPCLGCHTTELKYMIPWLTISFFLPQLVMIISTAYLIIRLYQQRANFNKRPEWSVLQKIVAQMAIYVIWSCLYYCPVSFYNLSLIIDPSKYSPDLKTVMNIVNTVIVQSYPILTFIFMLLCTRRKQAQQKRGSALKLNNLSTITPVPANETQN
ncbi:unnamed protein product [Adineta steineri]|uniref:G-protein coupled receptors family 1 profile domain-containing protein n=1 Tax=Adineta steineri TaxID=433720 RepID=A0A814I145_9BILA|nr:unnamed protein product [Adineta steineri]CAF1018120.1 unnamed protein product [Adineta steineri]CAF3691697.1 unnamed protein product [Adineta steineri]CAF3721961.1 unnamed protein product [Adineta steineri]